jgi:hypothetical protein
MLKLGDDHGPCFIAVIVYCGVRRDYIGKGIDVGVVGF